MRKFFIVWTGQAFSLFGSALVQFALVWWLTKSTGSATVLAMATLVALLPQVLAGPFIGVLVDRWDRKRIMIVADISIALVTATQCRGTVLVHEKMFESRMYFTDKLVGLGASVILCDPHRAVVVGPSRLTGGVVESPDIRAGMALLIAALGADGTSRIKNIRQIERGYENIDGRLRSLGARVQREE